MILRKTIGITLFFIGIALWGILFIYILLIATPVLLLVFCAGWLTHARYWPELKEYRIWGFIRDQIFNFQVYGEENIPKENTRIIWAIYPHGHFALTGIFYWALNPKFTDVIPAVHSVLFYIPLMSTFVKWIGAIGVTQKELHNALNNNQSIFMYPGGVADMSFEGNEYKKRRGFLRIARETQSTIIPVWCPDERSYYSQWLPFGHVLESIFGFPIPIFIYGRWWCPLLPKKVDISRIMIGVPVKWDSETQELDYENEIKRLQEINSIY